MKYRISLKSPTLATASKKESAFTREELLGIFYGASMGGGTLAGLITYGVTYLKDIETQCAISISTAAGAGGSLLTTIGTAALFVALRPKKENYSTGLKFRSDEKEFNRRFAYAATGALIGLTEMSVIAGFLHQDGPIIYKMQPPYIAPPTIVQNTPNKNQTTYHTDNGFILSKA